MHACMHACMHAYRHTDIQTYRQTDIHTYIWAICHSKQSLTIEHGLDDFPILAKTINI